MALPELWPGDTPASWIDDIGHSIAERYRHIEDALRATLERLAAQHLEQPDDLVARYRAIQELREQAERLVRTVDPAELAKWATEEAAMGASAEIARTLFDFPAYAARGVAQVTALTAGGAYAVAAVELDLRDSLRALNARILRAPVDAYQAMTSKHVGDLLAGITTSRALHRRILDEYLADGISGFVDKADRRWTIGAYSEMATRTAASRAWRDQSVASMEAAGITTFTPVIGSSACDHCAPWAGKILTDGGPTGDIIVPHAITAEPTVIHVDATLDEWRASGAGHPNCRDTLVPGLPGGPDPTKYTTHDPDAQAAREKLRELERDVRAAKRDGDPDEIGAAQAALRKHVEDTGINRREHREQLPFADGGTKNPRGRRVNPIDTPPRRPRPTPADWSQAQPEQIVQALEELVPGVRVTGANLITADRLEQIRGYLQPFEELLTRFPRLKAMPEIAFVADRRNSAAAWVSSSSNRSIVNRLTFNVSSDLTTDVMERARNHGWLHAAAGVDGRRYVTTHELGHVADFVSGQAPNREGMRILRELVDPSGTLKSDAGVLARALKAGHISEYASKSVYEMVAEAFATVETSPSIATAAERAIHAAILKALKGGG